MHSGQTPSPTTSRLHSSCGVPLTVEAAHQQVPPSINQSIKFIISVDQFHRFFIDKVEAVRNATAGGSPPTFQTAPTTASLTALQPVAVDDVITLIQRLPDKSCVADTLPVPQLKLVADLVAPFLTKLFNRSLSTGIVPSAFKSALITPPEEAGPTLPIHGRINLFPTCRQCLNS